MSGNELKTARVILIGCGDIGSQLGLECVQAGVSAVGLRRNIAALPEQLSAYSLDYSSDDMKVLADWEGDLAVFTPTPSARDAEGYRQGYLAPVQRFLEAREGAAPSCALFVSSTRVYGQQDGGWVSEQTPAQAADEQGEVILQAERLLEQSQHRLVVVRPGGIYGRSPSRLLERISGGEVLPCLEGGYGNRIHRDDLVGLLWHLSRKLLAGEALSDCYLAVDDAPIKNWEVEQWLARQIGVTDQQPAKARPGRGKRCRNTALHQLGYRLRYPDYRAGYRELLAGD